MEKFLHCILCIILLTGMKCFLKHIVHKDEKNMEQVKLKWANSDDGTVDIVLWNALFLSLVVSMMIIPAYFIVFDFESVELQRLKDGGILMALIIPFTGWLSGFIFDLLQKLLAKIEKGHISPIEENNKKWMYATACIVMIIFFAHVKYQIGFLTFLSILLGKFLWFDFDPGQVKEEINSLKRVPAMSLLINFAIILFTLYMCFLKEVMTGCVCAILICTLLFCVKEKELIKFS